MGALVHSCGAGEMRIDAMGGRFGFPHESRSKSFRQAEAFAVFDLPWRWEMGRAWHLQSQLDVSAGWLRGRSKDAGIATAGPAMVLRHERFPVSLDLGSSATLLTRDKFGTKDFGIPFQFTSHAGVNWDVTRHMRAGYRYQHMSNARLHRNNPGLDLHVVALSYRF
jgi:hypothetical protein